MYGFAPAVHADCQIQLSRDAINSQVGSLNAGDRYPYDSTRYVTYVWYVCSLYINRFFPSQIKLVPPNVRPGSLFVDE